MDIKVSMAALNIRSRFLIIIITITAQVAQEVQVVQEAQVVQEVQVVQVVQVAQVAQVVINLVIHLGLLTR